MALSTERDTTSTTIGRRRDELAWSMRGDLGTLASFAAIELDRLARGIPTNLDGLRHLVPCIRSEMPTLADNGSIQHLTDPSTVLAMNEALEHSYLNPQEEYSSICDVVRGAEKVTKVLEQVIIDGRGSQQSLNTAAVFCRVLAKQILARQQPMDIYQKRDI